MMDFIKAINVLDFLAIKIPNLSKKKAIKLIYFAEKEHLQSYGSFIVDDLFVKWEQGPIPSNTLNMIHLDSVYEYDKFYMPDKYKKYLKKYLKFGNDEYRIIKSIKEPDWDEFSDSEIEVLNKIIDQYGDKDANTLGDLTHKESWWDSVKYGETITIREFVKDLSEEDQEEIRLHHEESEEIKNYFKKLYEYFFNKKKKAYC